LRFMLVPRLICSLTVIPCTDPRFNAPRAPIQDCTLNRG
jgi:hypothetical protein